MLTLFKTPSGALVNLNYVCAIDCVDGYGVRGIFLAHSGNNGCIVPTKVTLFEGTQSDPKSSLNGFWKNSGDRHTHSHRS